MRLTWALTIPATMALAALIATSYVAGSYARVVQLAGQLDGVWITRS
jgi:hypothetical protein